MFVILFLLQVAVGKLLPEIVSTTAGTHVAAKVEDAVHVELVGIAVDKGGKIVLKS